MLGVFIQNHADPAHEVIVPEPWEGSHLTKYTNGKTSARWKLHRFHLEQLSCNKQDINIGLNSKGFILRQTQAILQSEAPSVDRGRLLGNDGNADDDAIPDGEPFFVEPGFD